MASKTPLEKKQREPRENQEFTRRHDHSYNTPHIKNRLLYDIDKVSPRNWRLFMWFASLEKVEDYIYLFIVIWDTIRDEDPDPEFIQEIAQLIEIISELETDDTNYSKILNDYEYYRCNNQKLTEIFVNNAWVELENIGLKSYSYAVEDQLVRCSFLHKKYLRRMIFDRLKSFQSFIRRMEDAKVKEPENDKCEVKKRESKNSQVGTKNDSNKALLEEIDMLRDQLETLKKENSRQQAALGNLINVSWDCNDPNNANRLISNIDELQDELSDFTMVQGIDYDIIDETAEELLKDNNCKAKYPSTKANVVLGTLLQRSAINTILESTDKYFHGGSSETSESIDYGTKNLERDIISTTESLMKYTEQFRDERKGEDEITKITPIKIRQHVYSTLSCRGLPDEHPLIKETANKLLSEMNKYRTVVDEETKSELNDQAIQITRKVIDIFYFCLKTQANIPTYEFFKTGQAVDMRFMQGSFGREDKKLEVEACGFPCIGIFEGDKSNHKIFSKANVIPRPKVLEVE